MKKILLSVVALMMATISSFAGDGTKENPYTVAEIIAFTPMDGTVTAYVKGYIVGTVPSGSDPKTFTTDAGANASATNLFMADTQSETDYNKCIPVQLPKGDVRTALNLQDNPTNLGKTLVINAQINKYFGLPGLKSATEFELSGETTYKEDGGETTGGDEQTETTQTNYIFTKVTNVSTEGQYLIVANVDGALKAAQNIDSSKKYGYLYGTDVTAQNDKITMTSLDNAFTIKGGTNIIDQQGRYMYQTGTYNSFNVATDATDGIDWTFTFNEDGTVKITNTSVNKTIQWDTQYSSYGSYDTEKGIYPSLYLLTSTEESHGTAIQNVKTPATKGQIYDLQGRRVSNMTRGIYVVDGKKILK